jgi:hypothetical protein
MSAIVQIGFDGKPVMAGLGGLEARLGGFAKRAGSAIGSLGDLGGSLGTIGGALGLGLMVKRGFEFNQTMQDGEVAIGNVLKTYNGLNDEAAKSEAAKVVQLIAEAEPKAAGGLQELTQGFIATAAAAAGAGISTEQNVDLVARFANALSNSGLPLDQLNQELRSVLTANVTSDSFIGKLLEGKGLDNKRILQLTQEGKLYGEIVKELGAMGEAGDTAGVAFSTLGSAVDKALGAVTMGLFGEAVDGAKALAEVIEDMLPVLEDVGKGWAGLAKAGVGFFQGMTDAGAALMMTLDSSAGGTALERWQAANDELEAQYEQRRKIREKAEAEEKKVGGAVGGGAAVGSPAPRAGAAGAGREQAMEAATARLREQYGQAQFDALQSNATLEQQIANLKQLQVTRAEELRREMDAGPITEQRMLEFATADLALEQERLGLQKQLNKQRDDEAKKAKDEVEARDEAVKSLTAEAEILAAKAAGQEEVVKRLEREEAIRERVKQIVEQTGLSQDKALAAATKMQDLTERAEKAEAKKGEDVERRIQGYSWEKMGGADEARARAAARRAAGDEKRARAYKRSFGGLDEFYADQKDPGFARAKTPALDAFFGRKGAGEAGVSMRRAEVAAGGVRSDPAVGILGELKALFERNVAAAEAIAVA